MMQSTGLLLFSSGPGGLQEGFKGQSTIEAICLAEKYGWRGRDFQFTSGTLVVLQPLLVARITPGPGRALTARS
jgi:hypothetical protein